MKFFGTMKASDLIRLFRKNIVLLLLIPALLGTAVAFLTKNIYSSKTTLYTGMTTGTNVQLDQSFNLFTSNAAFDNMINVIQSRETSQEVGIRLLAQHLMLSRHDPRYISLQSWLELKRATPAFINKLVVRHIYYKTPGSATDTRTDSSRSAGDFTFNDASSDNQLNLQPAGIDPAAYEITVKNLNDYMVSNDTNYIYKLLNFNNPHYSIKAISSVNVQRISSSDLIELKYNSDDPGICQQTLIMLTAVCMKNYKKIKESRSDAVVKYFEFKLKASASKLAAAEDHLLKFNEENKIVNFADQSRAAGNEAGNLEALLQSKRIKLAGDNAAIQKLQEKMNAQQDLQSKSTLLISKRNQLAEINIRLSTAESSDASTLNEQDIANLKSQAETLRTEISSLVDEMYNSKAAAGDANQNALMENYLTNVKDYEETKAGISGLESRIQSAQKEYDNYAPAGVTLKRIEREIAVAEQEYLEVLKGLNLAKLKVQDVDLSSNIKAVDPPYYPLSPNPTKRLMLIVIAGILGFLIVVSVILILEYLDPTLKNPDKAARILGLESAGVYPRITDKNNTINLPFITSRLLEMMIEQVDLHPKGRLNTHEPRTILFFSTQSDEGKTTILENFARKLRRQGKRVIAVNFSGESLLKTELSQMSTEGVDDTVVEPVLLNGNKHNQTQKHLNGHNESPDESRVGLAVAKTEGQSGSEGFVIYHVDEGYYSLRNAEDLLLNSQYVPSFKPDYILVELPPLLHFPYPAGLVASADLSVMVCRSNRAWSDADQNALKTFMKRTRHSPLFLLNGVEMHVVKSALGNVGSKETWINRTIRRKVKIS